MNKAIIFGILGGDATVGQAAQNGSTPIKFSVAVTEKRANGESHTEWFACTKWVSQGGSTKIAEYLKKGVRVCVSGKISARCYENKAYLELNVQDVTLGGSPQQAEPAAQANEPFQVPDNNDGLPF